MKRASIRVQEPTPELIEKIRRARVAISQQTPSTRSGFIPARPTMPLGSTIAASTGSSMTPSQALCCTKSGSAPPLP